MSNPNTQLSTLKSILNGDAMREQFARALPKHLSPERFCRIAITALSRTPKLQQCTQESLFKCLLELSAFGLEPDGRRAHLIPYGDQATLIIDYRGLAELAMRSGIIAKLHTDIICDNDIFEYNLGEIVQHKIDWKHPRGEMYAAYAMAVTKEGAVFVQVLTKDEIDAIKKRSRSGSNGPWVTDYNEMAKKGLALDTPIPTPFGWTTMASLNVGDLVFDMNGQQTKVIAKSKVKNLPCFKVNFTNGDSIICDDEHRWVARAGKSNANKQKYEVMTVNKIQEAIEDGLSVTIPVQKTLEIPEVDLPIDPYLFGYWLGDGNKTCPAITCGADDVDHVVDMVKGSKYKLGKIGKDKRTGAFTIRAKGGMLQDLRSLGVLNNKAIPEIYLRASKQQRLDLLCGLMDSDGHIDKQRGRAHFYNTNQGLSDGVAELVSSLGDVPFTTVKKMNGFGTSCIAYFVGWKPSICPVKLKRKMGNFQPRKITPYRAVASVESIPSVPTQCIAVASHTKTYLAGKSMAVTHNTAFRRLSKWLPLSAEFRDAQERDEEEAPVEREVTPAVTGSFLLGAKSEAAPEAVEEEAK